jgi:hypothetical protein
MAPRRGSRWHTHRKWDPGLPSHEHDVRPLHHARYLGVGPPRGVVAHATILVAEERLENRCRMFIGLVVLLIANNIRQEKFAARARLLWAAVRYVEQRAEPNAKIAWYSGDSTAGELNIEEGIHFRWHLLNRGRADIAIGLFDLAGNRLDRVELPQFEGEPNWKIGGKSMGAEPRVVESRFQENYQFGRKFFECQIGR